MSRKNQRDVNYGPLVETVGPFEIRNAGWQGHKVFLLAGGHWVRVRTCSSKEDAIAVANEIITKCIEGVLP